MRILKKTFVSAGITCGAAWLTKTALIAANGGSNTHGGVVALLWMLGMATCLVAAATGTALLLGRAPGWARWWPASPRSRSRSWR